MTYYLTSSELGSLTSPVGVRESQPLLDADPVLVVHIVQLACALAVLARLSAAGNKVREPVSIVFYNKFRRPVSIVCYTQRKLFGILLIQPEIRFHLPFSQ